MCGLAGLASADPAVPVSDPDGDVSVMLAALSHRGPDGEGLRVLQGAALGHRRLAVIDLSPKGAQPMTSGCAAKTDHPCHWIVLNGEIYNYLELRSELLARGHLFASATDTEVILHLYEERGDACVDSLRGMFAFAIWDVMEKRLLLARDRLGKKPLYYRIERDRIVFASELQALVALARRRGQPVHTDNASLRRYLALKYVPGTKSAVAGIEKVPPASVLVYERGRARVTSYWSLPEANMDEEPTDTGRLIPELKRALGEATALRLRSDVPVGLFLSGGLDSSIIAAEMTALVRAGAWAGPMLTFTVGFPQRDYDETKGARQVADALGTRHHEIRIAPTSAQTVDLLPLLARRMDQPFADSSALAVYHLAREVRAHVTVALSGDGADELFLGYERYRAHDIAQRRTHSLALSAPAVRLMRGLVRTVGTAPGRRNLAGRATRFLDAAALPTLERNNLWITCIDPALAAAVAPGLGDTVDPLDTINRAYVSAGPRPAMASIQRADCLVYLPDDILHKVDSGCMAHGLEPRAPFLDHRVVELAMRIPASVKRRRGRGKAILREAYAGDLPAQALNRRKAGFGLPLDHWLRGELAGYCRDLLLDQRTLSRGLYARDGIERMLEDHVSGRANREEAIWTLVMLEHWHRSVLETGWTTA